ncbi:hypothetical protein O9992_25670 [Vibrio lentus]|nr:hypothetical protein [Vibrio lentus]
MEQDIKQQTSQIEQVATAIQYEMGASSDEIAPNANGAADSASRASGAISIGQQRYRHPRKYRTHEPTTDDTSRPSR